MRPGPSVSRIANRRRSTSPATVGVELDAVARPLEQRQQRTRAPGPAPPCPAPAPGGTARARSRSATVSPAPTWLIQLWGSRGPVSTTWPGAERADVVADEHLAAAGDDQVQLVVVVVVPAHQRRRKAVLEVVDRALDPVGVLVLGQRDGLGPDARRTRRHAAIVRRCVRRALRSAAARRRRARTAASAVARTRARSRSSVAERAVHLAHARARRADRCATDSRATFVRRSHDGSFGSIASPGLGRCPRSSGTTAPRPAPARRSGPRRASRSAMRRHDELRLPVRSHPGTAAGSVSPMRGFAKRRLDGGEVLARASILGHRRHGGQHLVALDPCRGRPPRARGPAPRARTRSRAARHG